MRYRRGFSLIELLIVLSVGTAMLMVAMAVLYKLKETQVGMGQRLAATRTITRLGDQFRADVHAASGIEHARGEASSGESCWELAIEPDTVVRYRTGAGVVRRDRICGNAATHEDYRLPARLRASISVPEREPDIAALILEPAPGAPPSTRAVRIEALLRFDSRHGAMADRNGQK